MTLPPFGVAVAACSKVLGGYRFKTFVKLAYFSSARAGAICIGDRFGRFLEHTGDRERGTVGDPSAA